MPPTTSVPEQTVVSVLADVAAADQGMPRVPDMDVHSARTGRGRTRRSARAQDSTAAGPLACGRLASGNVGSVNPDQPSGAGCHANTSTAVPSGSVTVA